MLGLHQHGGLMQFSRQSSVQATPNVTPMVDVMLVLLIIFMVVVPALLDGFTATPPNAVNVRDHPNDSTDVTLGIDASGHYFWNKKPIQFGELAAKVEA